MEVTFCGAAREVTGSMHLLTTENDRILLDCGMFQGRRRESAEKNRVLPFDPQIITNLVLSHAHIDHSGRIPLLTKGNFSGRVICTRATAAACEYLLPDCAHIQESDAGYLNYKAVRSTLAEMRKTRRAKRISKGGMKKIKQFLKKGRHELNTETINELIRRYGLEGVQPLYTSEDARHALTCFDGYPYGHEITIGTNVTCTLYDAGHILGSAITIVRAQENGRPYTIGYTGDIGRFEKPIIKDPTLDFKEADRNVDLLIMESTYGNRLHGPVADLKPHMKKVLVDTYNRGGTLLIPSFAFGRTQEIIYLLHELYNENEVPHVPIFVDSPLAMNITRVFGEHPELYDQETHANFLQQGQNPFSFRGIHFVQSVEESMDLNRDESPHIVIAASGMCEAGRILHHLRYKIHNPRTTILIVGFMAQNTLGRRIVEQGLAYQESGGRASPPLLRFLNKEYPLKARVVTLGGLSAHGDRKEMLHWLKQSNLSIKRIAVVHGEEDQSLAFCQHLEKRGYRAFAPRAGETVALK
ncbi:MAG: MBL fold metallo-hydrolase [Thermodesulfobacteriota bacterium]|nr:MBL fold metallo-hydrolase [Thermodesulfobacteriota bacterium]